MDLRTNKLSYYTKFPLPLDSNTKAGLTSLDVRRAEYKAERFEVGGTTRGEVDLPILATATDLREAVKFLKYKPNGVSVVEIMNAEPRRVFDARKIAAYEFWGIIKRDEERLRLTELGENLAKNTDAECEINRRILRSIPAYFKAIEWIYYQKLELATYFDVADFWRKSQATINLSSDNEDNIEAVIVSFFSLCHAAEIGIAIIGKRGQPARLNVNLEQIKSFLAANDKNKPLPINYRNTYEVNKNEQKEVNCVYISAEDSSAVVKNLASALELADFSNLTYTAKPLSNDLLPLTQVISMKQCQAAIFLLGEKDVAKQKGKSVLRCDRIAEISVAGALFGERVMILWQSRELPPDCIQQSGIKLFADENNDWEINVKLVKYLKKLTTRTLQH